MEQRQVNKKVYFNTNVDSGGIYLISKKNDAGITASLRFAGKPKFILTKYIEKYGEEKGKKLYREMVAMMMEVGKTGYSPMVMYVREEL